jgi:two-component system response regulator AtoC
MDKILLIDDDQSIRETLNVLLSREYKVILAENGKTGIQKFKSESPDLVITDLKMDDYDGIEVLKKVKEFDNDVPVILITAFEDIQSSIDAIQFGAYDYLGKPLDIEKFKICVKRALHCKRLNDKIYNIVSQDIDEYRSAFNFVAETPSMKHIVKSVGHVALSRMNVLIQGESGTGKELIAKLIHYSGVTKNSPFIAVNCSALTETILESELFGHVRGAFTNAYRDKKGKFELAGDGTLFLDEVSEISSCNQVKLLRVIQEKEFEKVGGEETIPFNGRIITATNKNLKELVQNGKFREDLYFRLKVFLIEIPPLRDRKEVIPSLVTFIVNKINRELHKNIRKVPFEVMEILMNYEWKGNIRELENTLYQAMVLSSTDVLEKENIIIPGKFNNDHLKKREGMSIAEVEKEHIKLVLDSTNGNKHKTSEILGISMATLYNKIAEYNF